MIDHRLWAIGYRAIGSGDLAIGRFLDLVMFRSGDVSIWRSGDLAIWPSPSTNPDAAASCRGFNS
jgi:hypothetical protein